MMINEIEQKAITLLQDLIQINTTNELGNEIEAAKYIRNFLMEKGIDSEIVYSPSGRANLISKIKAGTTAQKESIILLSHLDVVSANEEEWVHHPFSGEIEGGTLWGRGTLDTKQLTAMHLLAFIQLNESRMLLNRDIYFIASADEENGSKEGMEYLASEQPDLFKGAIVLSEGGGFTYKDQEGQEYMLFASGEKGTVQVRIVAEGEGGHAGSPPENQAIYHLADALEALVSNPFLNSDDQLTRHFHHVFTSELELNPDSFLAQLFKYMKKPTVQVDLIDIGDKINVVPYLAEAVVEMRLLPYQTESDAYQLLEELLSPFNVRWKVEFFQSGYVNELNSEIMECFKSKARELNFNGEWVPFTALGKTDGRFISRLAHQIYGLSPVLTPFVEVLKRVHNKDENLEIDSYLFGVELVKNVLEEFCINQGGE